MRPPRPPKRLHLATPTRFQLNPNPHHHHQPPSARNQQQPTLEMRLTVTPKDPPRDTERVFARKRLPIDSKHGTTDTIPVVFVAGVSPCLGHRCGVCALNCGRIVRVERDGRCPAVAKSGSAETSHRFNVFCEQAAVLNELGELFPREDRTPFAMVAVLPAAFVPLYQWILFALYDTP